MTDKPTRKARKDRTMDSATEGGRMMEWNVKPMSALVTKRDASIGGGYDVRGVLSGIVSDCNLPNSVLEELHRTLSLPVKVTIKIEALSEAE